MFNDSYVFVVFQDGTDLFWARGPFSKYMQQLEGLLPPGVHPVIGPDATGAGWVYEYFLLDKSHNLNLADLDTLQDWYVRYQLGTVPVEQGRHKLAANLKGQGNRPLNAESRSAQSRTGHQRLQSGKREKFRSQSSAGPSRPPERG